MQAHLLDDRPWYDVPGAAAKANLTQPTIRDYIRSGRLRATKFGRVWRISPEDLDAFLAGGVT
ncbi:helix-turn-helix domain-containing protein [Mycobacterium sp.]|uniref:helix-turn-helix domain-containing protein n=1 Tax=Mycobacterium sp. TaxID=1785 RepID=UPI003BB11B9E